MLQAALDARQWLHLRDIKLPSIDEKEVRLILGSNVPDAFWVLKERRATEENHTPYVYVLAGPNRKERWHRLSSEC